jgi:hypothetical protein
MDIVIHSVAPAIRFCNGINVVGATADLIVDINAPLSFALAEEGNTGSLKS